MKLFVLCLLLSLPLVFSACAPSQVSTAPPAPPTPADQTEPPPPVVEPPPAEVEPSPVVVVSEPQPTPLPTPTIPVAATADSISEKRLVKAQEPKTLLQVIRDAGVPDDNLIPGRKEQIAVYQREGKYQFYHFRESRLVATGEYPRSLIEQMQQRGSYPREVIRDFAQLPQ
jgi:hypothetical protein